MRDITSKGLADANMIQSVLSCGVEGVSPRIMTKARGLAIALGLSLIANVVVVFIMFSLRHEVHNCWHVLGVK